MSANVDIDATPFATMVVLEQRFVIARSLAKLGRMEEAETEFQRLIAEAHRTHLVSVSTRRICCSPVLLLVLILFRLGLIMLVHICVFLCAPHQVFYEVFACRDLITHVLDAAGRRNEGMAALGGAIRRNQLAPSEFTPLLGSGLDAEAAVVALDK